MRHQSTKFKVPFFVLLVVCVLLAAALVMTLLPGRSSDIMLPSMEGEIIEVRHGTLYYQTFLLRTTDGVDYYIDARPDTKICDSKGEPVLVSGLTPGLRIKVTYEGFVNSFDIYSEDGIKTPTHYSYCPEIQILP